MHPAKKKVKSLKPGRSKRNISKTSLCTVHQDPIVQSRESPQYRYKNNTSLSPMAWSRRCRCQNQHLPPPVVQVPRLRTGPILKSRRPHPCNPWKHPPCSAVVPTSGTSSRLHPITARLPRRYYVHP